MMKLGLMLFDLGGKGPLAWLFLCC